MHTITRLVLHWECVYKLGNIIGGYFNGSCALSDTCQDQLSTTHKSYTTTILNESLNNHMYSISMGSICRFYELDIVFMF